MYANSVYRYPLNLLRHFNCDVTIKQPAMREMSRSTSSGPNSRQIYTHVFLHIHCICIYSLYLFYSINELAKQKNA